MRESTRTVVAGVVLTLLAHPHAARAAGPSDTDVAGVVVDSTSRWGYGGTLIVTETTVETASGETVRVHQLGGIVGDIGMRLSHAPPIAPMGATVTLRVTDATSLDGRRHNVLTEVLGMSALPPGSLGFVQTTNETNTPLFWENGCVQIALHDAGAAAIPAATEVDAITDSLAQWQGALETCSPLDVRFSGLTPIEPAFDGYNVIRFREDSWCRPAAGADPQVCHDPAAAGLTFLTFAVSGSRNGAILDADIELNGVDFGLVYNGTGAVGAACPSDIPNTMVHELGHFLGLDHTCWDGVGPRPVDNNGDAVPSCDLDNQLPAAVREATMFAFQDCNETIKASLEADDSAGVCAIYPATGDPGECLYPVVDGGFCAASGSRGPASWLALIAITALAFRRRRTS